MKRNPVFIILGILLGLNILAWAAVWSLRPQGLEVTFFDVGQGDAILIIQGTTQLLIDTGPDRSIETCLYQQMPFFDRHLIFHSGRLI